MHEEAIFAGFGGQGIMLMGQLLTYAGMMEGANVSWMPSYEREMRGGHCQLPGGDIFERVSSPLVTEPLSLVALNKPSLQNSLPGSPGRAYCLQFFSY